MQIFKKIKISYYTYLLFLIGFFCGYLKNLLIIFIICFIHELGHAFFIKLFKYEIVKIEILPFGGYTLINKKINSSINKDIIISLGGIFFQLFIHIFLLIYKELFLETTYNLIIYYNYILVIFNILPIIPLDGSVLLNKLLEKFFSYKLAFYLNIIISIISLGIFLLINIIFAIDNFVIISFLFYQIIITYKNYKYVYNKFLLERLIYDLDYKKIDNNTKDIKSLRKEVFHYFKDKNKYANEKKVINKYLIDKRRRNR